MKISWLTGVMRRVIGAQTSSTEQAQAQGQTDIKYDFLRRDLKKSRAILVQQGALDEKLTPALLNAYTNARIVLEESGENLGYLTSWTAMLINKGVAPDELDVFCDAVTYRLQMDLVDDSSMFTSGFFGLIKEDYSSEEWELYKDVINYHKVASLSLDNVTFDFLGLVKVNPTRQQLQLYKDSIALFKERNKDLSDITGGFAGLIKADSSFELLEIYKDAVAYYLGVNGGIEKLSKSFVELAKAKPSVEQVQKFKDLFTSFKQRGREVLSLALGFEKSACAKVNSKELEIYNDLVTYYIENNWDITNLTNHFIDLIKAKPEAEQWQAYKEAVTKHKEKKLQLYLLTSGFSQVVKPEASLEQLQIFGNLALYYLEKGWDLNRLPQPFCQLIEAKPSKEELKVFSDAASYYLEQAWDLNGLITPFCQLIKAKLSKEELKVFSDAASYYLEKGLDLDLLIEPFCQLIEAKPSKEEWSLYKDLILHHKENNLELNNLTICFNEFVREKISPLIREVFKTAILFHARSGDTFPYHIHGHDIKSICLYLKRQNASPVMLNNYLLAVNGGHLKSPEESKKLLVNITVQSAIANLVRADSTKVAEAAQYVIEDIVTSDPLPYPLHLDQAGKIPNPKVQKMYEEIISIYRRVLNGYYGFSSLTFDTKRPPSKEPPFITRFGKNVAKSVKYLYAKDHTLFPGRGFVISNPILEKIFAPDIEAKTNGKDPFHKYTTAWPWAKKVFYDFPKTHFIFTRGFMAISCPGEKYELEDLDGKKISYSFIFFNNHHHNYGGDVALLVPTKALANKLKGTAIKYEDYPGVPKGIKDINEVGFTPQGLIDEAKAMRAKVLNIGWGSNIGGGLCNADEPDSPPFHEWEKERRAQGHTRDFYGHIHKSHITGTYLPTSNKYQEKLMIPFRKRHEQLFEITDRYLKLRDLFYRSLAFGHKGLTAKEPVSNIDMDDEAIFDKLDELRTEQMPEEGEINNLDDNPNLLTMLEEAYKWNKARETGNNNRNDFPILVAAEDRDRWSRPESPFYLDTFDMVLIINGKKISLDPNGIEDIERSIWYNKIIPEIMHSSKDLRFYDRRDLGIN